MSDETSILKIGDYKLNGLWLFSQNIAEPIDLSQVYASIEIFESMWNPFLTLNITILDNINILSKFRLTGEEFMMVDLRGPGDVGIKSATFYVYSVSDRKTISDMGVSYTFQCISKEALVDMNTKISKAFSGQPSDIVKNEILKTHFQTDKPLIIEPTKNAVSFISNYWSPVNVATYLCDRAVSSDATSPSYVFYETIGSYVFSSLNFLVKATPVQVYYYTPSFRTPSKVQPESEYQIIENIYVDETFDYIKRIDEGAYGNQTLTINPIDKTYKYAYYDFSESFSRFNRLNEYPFNSDNATRRVGANFNTRIAPTGAYEKMLDEKTNEWFAQRRTEMAAIEAQSYQIDVPGTFYIFAGAVVNIFVYSDTMSRGDSMAQVYDEVLSGRHIVTSIRHYIDRERHKMSLQVNKDSLVKPQE